MITLPLSTHVSLVSTSCHSLCTLPCQYVISMTQQIFQKCDAASPSYSSTTDTSKTYFLGVDWMALKKEVNQLGFFGSIHKITQVFWEIFARLQETLNISCDIQRASIIEKLMPGIANFKASHINNFAKLEKEMLDQQVCLHKTRIKYLVASHDLPPTLISCQKVFQEVYKTGSAYRNLCEESFKEIYTPYLKNRKYHMNLFGLSYIEQIFDLLPILNMFSSFNKEEEIKKVEQKGVISTQFSDVDFLQLTGSQIIDLFKERLNTPFTLALKNLTSQYEEKLRDYHVVLDDEAGFHQFCLKKAVLSSDQLYQKIWNALE